MSSRTIVSTTLAYTGGYIFLVLLAVCLATGTCTLPRSRALSPCAIMCIDFRRKPSDYDESSSLTNSLLSFSYTLRVLILARIKQVCITSRKWSKSTRVLRRNSSKTRSKSPCLYTCFYFSSTACRLPHVSWEVCHKSRIRDYSRDTRLLKCKQWNSQVQS